MKHKKKRDGKGLKQNLAIAINEKVLLTNLKYVSPAHSDGFKMVDDPSATQWFQFSSSHYYPMTFVDLDGDNPSRPIALEKKKMKMSISCDQSGQDINISPTACEFLILQRTSDKTCWFTAIKNVYVAGTMTISFTCEGDDSIQGLSFTVDSRRSTPSSSSGALSDGPIHDGVSNKRRMSKRLGTPEEAILPTSEFSSVKKSKTRLPPSSFTENHGREVDDDTDILEMFLYNRHKSLYTDSILEYPQIYEDADLDANDRIDMPISLSQRNKGQHFQLKGPILSVNLPPSLIVALFNDRERTSEICEYITLLRKRTHKKNTTTRDRYLPIETSKSPTVSDLLNMLAEKAKENFVVEAESIIRHMRSLFERMIRQALLYLDEKIVYQPLLKAGVRGNEEAQAPLSEEFGPYHFLRLIVYMVLSTKSSTQVKNKNEKNGSIATKQELEEETGALAHIQEVMELAIELLDKRAHFLFY